METECKHGIEGGCAQCCYVEAKINAAVQAAELSCICKGSWRTIIHESEPLFGKKYKRGDDVYIFCGVMHGDDDYYYCMWRNGDMQLLSCVGSIEQHGFVAA